MLNSDNPLTDKTSVNASPSKIICFLKNIDPYAAFFVTLATLVVSLIVGGAAISMTADHSWG